MSTLAVLQRWVTRIWTGRPRVRQQRRRARATRLTLEALEGREVPSASPTLTEPLRTDGVAISQVAERCSSVLPSTAASHLAVCQTEAVVVPASGPEETSREVMFIDPAVMGYQQLAQGVRPGVEVVVLTAERAGLAQMADSLVGQQGLTAIHVISHGSPGAVQLGSTLLNAATLEAQAEQLAVLRNALSADGDLLLYGCAVGQGEQGQQFVQQLAQATATDVAASSDFTGAAARGGNWVLEVKCGQVESTIPPISTAVLADYSGLLVHVNSPTGVKWIESLYRNLLGRASDQGGMDFWRTAVQNGRTYESIAEGFLTSAEYCRRYATSLYQSLLGRAPDAGGLTSWTNALMRGQSIQSVVLAFCASEEFFTRCGRNNSRFVEGLYSTLLGRASDAGGRAYWAGLLNRGASRASVVQGFLGSNEYLGRQVDRLYQDLLHRAADANGRATWVQTLKGGVSLQTVMSCFLTSDEYRSKATGLHIDIVFGAGLNAAQQAAFRQAAARWERVIGGDLPDVTIAGHWIDDIQIFASASAIDGVNGILGQAKPDAVRATSLLPGHGIMTFDSADLAAMQANGSLVTVITHEMGHVLGFGTLWERKGLLSGVGTGSPVFTGRNAVAVYNQIFGQAARGVPVENSGLAGTINCHWLETGFDTELMTGWIDPGLNPLSRVTVASLADLGYLVNLDGADAYSPPRTSRAMSAPGSAAVADLMAVRFTSDLERLPPELVEMPAGTPADAAGPRGFMEYIPDGPGCKATTPVQHLPEDPVSTRGTNATPGRLAFAEVSPEPLPDSGISPLQERLSEPLPDPDLNLFRKLL